MSGAVLVTGARGLVGAAVVRAMSDAGLAPLGLERGQVDLSTGGAGVELQRLPQLDAIVHCAAMIPPAHEGPAADDCAAMNKRIDETVIRLAETRDVPLVYMSSMSVYAPGGTAPLDESARTDPPGPYAVGKLEAETQAMLRVASAVVLRLPSPYGTGMSRVTVLPRFLTMAREDRLVTFHGSGSREQDFVHVADVAAACVAAVRRRPRAVVNICSGAPTTMRELAELASATHPPCAVRASGRDDAAEGQTARYSRGRARQLLGWAPTIPLDVGLAEVSESLR